MLADAVDPPSVSMVVGVAALTTRIALVARIKIHGDTTIKLFSTKPMPIQ
jgi:hypothetical protein